jgi:hypothetical protein
MRYALMLAILLGVAADVRAQNQQTDWNKSFPPHKVIGNVYYVGSEQLASFLITTPDGDGAMSYNVAILGSIGVNLGYVLVNNKDYPDIADDYVKSSKALRSFPVDVFLGAHGSFYGLTTKYAQLEKGGPNPFIDPAGFKAHLDGQEMNFNAQLDEQKKATTK